jgi:DNA-dependent RNA polymerase auxiliary subunit epsilon
MGYDKVINNRDIDQTAKLEIELDEENKGVRNAFKDNRYDMGFYVEYCDDT